MGQFLGILQQNYKFMTSSDIYICSSDNIYIYIMYIYHLIIYIYPFVLYFEINIHIIRTSGEKNTHITFICFFLSYENNMNFCPTRTEQFEK